MSRELLGVRVPEHLKRLVDEDPRSNQEIVGELLEMRYSDSEDTTVQLKIDQKRRSIENLRSKLNDIVRELESEKDDLETLEVLQKTVEEKKEEDIRMVARGLDVIELPSQDSPIIRNDREFIEGEAERIGCSPRELKEAALEEYDG